MAYAGLSLDGKVALVTGSARGIGKALAVGLAKAGADVAVSDLTQRLEEAVDTQQQIEDLGQASRTYALDVRDVANIRSAIDRVASDFGKLDILVNNAGTRLHCPALEVTEEGWDDLLNTNLKGVFFCAQTAARHMINQGVGRIINIASQLAVVARPERSAYCGSKGGVVSLTRAHALEWISHGITVNAIGPGPTTTPGATAAYDRAPEEDQQLVENFMPLGRRMEAEELVGAAIYLASPSAGAITGQMLIVDGGWTAQ